MVSIVIAMYGGENAQLLHTASFALAIYPLIRMNNHNVSFYDKRL